MTEMVERVADALWATSEEQWDIRFDRAMAKVYARAAIAAVFDALEEPTTGMLGAGVDRGRESGYTDVIGVWLSMLAQARKEALE